MRYGQCDHKFGEVAFRSAWPIDHRTGRFWAGQLALPQAMGKVPLVERVLQEAVQVPALEGVGVLGLPQVHPVVLALAAYRATEAMGGLVLALLEPCFSCLSSDPHGSPLNRWMVTRS